MRYVVGLSGGIGSGKSAAAHLFAELGARVVDTDAIAHELTAPGGAAIEPIRSAFGKDMIAPDGSLDRAAMRRLVFEDAAAKAQLEAILHPMIGIEADARCMQSTAPYVVLVVPLLVETAYYRGRLERVLVVDCDEETQVSRTVARSGIPAEQVRAIMAAQASRAQRLDVADDVIDNNGDLAQLREQVLRLHASYMTRAGAA
jgi:dephospho-CoA kinase